MPHLNDLPNPGNVLPVDYLQQIPYSIDGPGVNQQILPGQKPGVNLVLKQTDYKREPFALDQAVGFPRQNLSN